MTPKELVYAIENVGAFGHAIADAVFGKGDKYSRIGFRFRERLGRRYGIRGLRLEKGKRVNSGIQLTVTDEKTPDSCRVALQPYTNFSTILSSNDSISVGCVGFNPAMENSEKNDADVFSETSSSALNPTHPTHPTLMPQETESENAYCIRCHSHFTAKFVGNALQILTPCKCKDKQLTS